MYIGDDMTKLKEKLQKMDIVDHGTRKRANTKRKFYKLTNVTFFASLLKDTPMGCKDTVLPEPLLKNHNANCFTFERNTTQPYNDKLCLFRALALHLHGNNKLEDENAKVFNLLVKSKEGNFKVLNQTIFQKLKTICSSIYFCLTLTSLMENSLVNLLVEVFRNMTKVSSFYDTTITFSTSATSTQNSKLPDAVLDTIFFQNWQSIKLFGYLQ